MVAPEEDADTESEKEAVGDTGADADTLPLPHELDEGVGDAGALSVTLLDSDGVPLMHADGNVESELVVLVDAAAGVEAVGVGGSEGDLYLISVAVPVADALVAALPDCDGGNEPKALVKGVLLLLVLASALVDALPRPLADTVVAGDEATGEALPVMEPVMLPVAEAVSEIEALCDLLPVPHAVCEGEPLCDLLPVPHAVCESEPLRVLEALAHADGAALRLTVRVAVPTAAPLGV